MEYYVGLDVSLKSTHICVIDRERQVVWRESVFLSMPTPNVRSGAMQRATAFLGNHFISAQPIRNVTLVLDTEEEGDLRVETWVLVIRSPTRLEIKTQYGTLSQRWCLENMW